MMVIDVATIKKAIKPKADSTLYNMKKSELIEYIRCLENNYNAAVWFNENQAQYIEKLLVFCKDCVHHERCMAEIIYQSENIKDPFCCRGERKDGGSND